MRDTLRNWRLSADLTSQEAAGLFGCAEATYNSWEAGRRTPSSAIDRLIQVYDLYSTLMPPLNVEQLSQVIEEGERPGGLPLTLQGLSQELRKARTTWELTQTAMAELLGVSYNSYKQWEGGRNPMAGTALACFSVVRWLADHEWSGILKEERSDGLDTASD
jgi:DNA-binding transcriptional regulator YiaG